MSEKTVDPAAPHGRDADGEPLAPFGYTVEGRPRKSNRGARAGQRGNKAPGKPRAGRTSTRDAERRDALLSLLDMAVVTPLAAVSMSGAVAKRLGDAQADAFAGDALLIANHGGPLADALIGLSQTKPKTLAWLDQVEEKAPYLALLSVGVSLAKSVAENHLNPRPDLAQAGRTLVRMRAEQMAEEIMAQAAAMGIPPEPPRMPTPPEEGNLSPAYEPGAA